MHKGSQKTSNNFFANRCMSQVFGRWISCRNLHSPNTANHIITRQIIDYLFTAAEAPNARERRQCITRAPFLFFFYGSNFSTGKAETDYCLYGRRWSSRWWVWSFSLAHIIFSQSICSTSPHTYPPLPASSSTGVTSSDTPQPTSDCDTESTSEILPIASSSSHQDNLQVTQSTQPVTEFITSSNASESLPTATRSISPPTALYIMFGRTRWCLLNSLFLLAVGTAKSVSAYQNASTAVNSLDLVIGIVWALM